MKISVRDRMDSLNGGIPMWIPRLADHLAVNGVGKVINDSIEDLKGFQDNHRKTHLDFLISGLKSLNQVELAAAVASIAEYPAQISALGAQYKEQSKALENIRSDWSIAAENAKKQILAWQKWACVKEAAARKEMLPWLRDDLCLEMYVGFELSGAHLVLSSPDSLARQEDFFKQKISSIRAVIERSYVNGVFDAALSLVDFDDALHELTKKQREFTDCENVFEEIKVDLGKCRESYYARREPLIQMLWLMPLSAKEALFWLCCPELEYSSLKNA
jgi:hypothetical protein